MLYTYPTCLLWVGYLKVSMAVWFPVPTKLWGNVDAQLSPSDLEKSHPMCGEKNNSLRLQLQWMCNARWHQAGTRDESWLRKDITSYCMTSLLSGATRCFLRDSHPPWPRTPTVGVEGGGKREGGRSLGKLSNCRNWSIWHTAGRNISEICSFQMNQRKIQNKTT